VLKENPKKLQYTHQSRDKNVWAAWYFLNALDVHTTIKGLKYSCIYESNLTLPRVPHRNHLIVHKTLLLSTVFRSDSRIRDMPGSPTVETWSDSDISLLNLMIGLAVINNHKLTNEAKNNPNTCPKR